MKIATLLRTPLRLALTAGCLALASAAALAQGSWPTKAVTLVVPFPAGGPTDVVARAVAQQLGEGLGQTVIVENKPGAGGNIGSSAVAHAAPDGYTLLVGAATLTTSAYLFKQLNYDPLKDLTPIALLATAPVFIWVDHRFPAQTLGEMVTLVKARPGHYNYSSSAPATMAHLGSLLFFDQVGAQLVHVNYKGSAQAINDLLGGVFPIYFEVAQPVVPHLKAGKVRALAVVSNRRSPLMPEVPSVAELGFPSIDAVAFITLMAPAGTPRAVIDKLNTLTQRALQSPDLRSKLSALYFEVGDGGQPETLGRWMRDESKKWGEVIRRHDLKME